MAVWLDPVLFPHTRRKAGTFPFSALQERKPRSVRRTLSNVSGRIRLGPTCRSFPTHAEARGPALFPTSSGSMRTCKDQAKRILLRLLGSLEGEFHGRPGCLVREVEAPLREGCQRFDVPLNPPFLVGPGQEYRSRTKGAKTGGYDWTRRVSELRDARRPGGSVRVVYVPNRPVTAFREWSHKMPRRGSGVQVEVAPLGSP